MAKRDKPQKAQKAPKAPLNTSIIPPSRSLRETSPQKKICAHLRNLRLVFSLYALFAFFCGYWFPLPSSCLSMFDYQFEIYQEWFDMISPILWSLIPGEVAERLNAPVSKTGIPARVSWVRIPPSPPFSSLWRQRRLHPCFDHDHDHDHDQDRAFAGFAPPLCAL